MPYSNIEKKDHYFRTMEEKWDLVNALWGGTDAMRGAGELYLPKFRSEDNEVYAMRLKTSTLYNAYKRSVQSNVSRLFSSEITIDGVTDAAMKPLDNVDLRGRALTEFMADTVTQAVKYGVSYILIDHPKEDQVGTEFVEARPYWINIKPTQTLSVRTQRILGVETLTHFKYFEQTTNTDATSIEEFTDLIRSFTLDPITKIVEFVVYERHQNGGWMITDEGTMDGLTYIPVVAVYGQWKDYMFGDPVLFDLAEMNIRHWQSASDQQWVLHFARTPILFGKGLTSIDANTGEEKAIAVGPNALVMSGNPESDLRYVEHSGQAIESGRKDLQDLQDQMSVIGLDVSVNTPGNRTATETSINTAQAQSLLRLIAVQTERAIEQCIWITQDYMGIASEVHVDINMEYADTGNTEAMTKIMEMYHAGLVTAQDVLIEAKRRKILRDEQSIEDIENDRRRDTSTTEASGDTNPGEDSPAE